jgi:hypothetical protein
MRLCRECGKPVEAHAQFCPWCFAFPGTAEAEEPVPAAVAAAPTSTVAPAPPAPVPVVQVELVSPAPPPPPNPFAAPPAPPAFERSSPAVVFSSGPVTPSVWPRVAMVGGAVAVVVALVVGVLAFRGDDDTATRETIAAADAPSETSQEIVERIVLRAEDLGVGWSRVTAPSAPTTADPQAVADCLGVSYATPVARSTAAFQQSDFLTIGGDAGYWADAGQARAQAESAAHPRLGECSEALAEAQAGTDVEIVTEHVGPLPGRPETVHLRLRIPIEGTGVSLFLDTVSTSRDRITVSVFAVSGGEPTPDDLLVRASDAMVSRI